MARRSGETQAHLTLKRAALFWAQQEAYSVVGTEIRVPNSNYRADVAAYRPDRKKNPKPGMTAIFECKQGRSDFLRDRHDLAQNLESLQELNERRARMEEQLGVHHPNLRCGDSLFQEYESVQLDALTHEGYQRLRRELQAVEGRIFGKTKFSRMVRWQCASLLYLVAPKELLRLEELPADWGWLAPELENWESEDVPVLTVMRRPRLLEASPERKLDLLQRIGMKGTGLVNREQGLESDLILAARGIRNREETVGGRLDKSAKPEDTDAS